MNGQYMERQKSWYSRRTPVCPDALLWWQKSRIRSIKISGMQIFSSLLVLRNNIHFSLWAKSSFSLRSRRLHTLWKTDLAAIWFASHLLYSVLGRHFRVQRLLADVGPVTPCFMSDIYWDLMLEDSSECSPDTGANVSPIDASGDRAFACVSRCSLYWILKSNPLISSRHLISLLEDSAISMSHSMEALSECTVKFSSLRYDTRSVKPILRRDTLFLNPSSCTLYF